MLNAKAWNAQVRQILHDRAQRGAPLGLEWKSWYEIKNGAVFFYPDGPCKAEPDIRTVVPRLVNEPVFICTGDGAMMLSDDGDISTENYFVDWYYENWQQSDPQNPDCDPEAANKDCVGYLCLVIQDLNISIQDAGAQGKPASATTKEPTAAYKPQTVMFLD